MFHPEMILSTSWPLVFFDYRAVPPGGVWTPINCLLVSERAHLTMYATERRYTEVSVLQNWLHSPILQNPNVYKILFKKNDPKIERQLLPKRISILPVLRPPMLMQGSCNWDKQKTRKRNHSAVERVYVTLKLVRYNAK